LKRKKPKRKERKRPLLRLLPRQREPELMQSLLERETLMVPTRNSRILPRIESHTRRCSKLSSIRCKLLTPRKPSSASMPKSKNCTRRSSKTTRTKREPEVDFRYSLKSKEYSTSKKPKKIKRRLMSKNRNGWQISPRLKKTLTNSRMHSNQLKIHSERTRKLMMLWKRELLNKLLKELLMLRRRISKKLKFKLINSRRPMKHSLSKERTGRPLNLPELLPPESCSLVTSRLP